jgi:peptide/nickel transport system permease protein
VSAGTAAASTVLNTAEPQPGQARGTWQRVWRRLRQDKVGLTGILVVLVVSLMTLLAPVIAPGDPTETHLELAFRPAGSPDHVLGTDLYGRDILSRVIWGARPSLAVGFAATCFALAIGATLGIVIGFYGGWFDTLSMRIVDVMLAFPYLLLAIVIAFLLSDKLGQGVVTAAVAITVVYVPQYFRVIRNHVISVREEPYVEAARALGARRRTIIMRYVFYNVIQSVPALATLNAADAILTLAGLSFLGYGIQPTEAAEWGYDISRAIDDAGAGIWWTGTFPGLAIVLLVTGFTLVGEGLNDVLNPLIRFRRVNTPRIPARDAQELRA